MGDFKIHEKLRSEDDAYVIVESLARQNAVDGNGYVTYNIEVSEWHTYFVAPKNSPPEASAIWVHNEGDEFCDAGVLRIKRLLEEKGGKAEKRLIARFPGQADKIRVFTAKTGVKLLPEFASSSIDDVIASSTRLKGQMAEGARAIAKKLGHAERGGYTSAFDGVEPTQANAERIIRETLSKPSRSFYGDNVIDVYNGFGQGVRIERQTNKFMGFLEESLSTQ